MKFVTFIREDKEEIGVVTQNNKYIVSLKSLLPDLKENSMISFINIYNKEIEKEIRAALDQELTIPVYDMDEIKLCAPIRKPIHDIICVGVNYKDHLEETKESFGEGFSKPSKTVYFSKRASEIIGADENIISRLDLDEQLDYEVELCVIIGKKCKDISKEEVEEYIFGYSIFNDISSRQLQQKHVQWFRGKSLDSYTAMGPWIVTKDEISFPVELEVKSFVNGESRQKSNTKLFIADIASIISEFSNGITLEPGDIIATGTPAGVGMGFHPPQFMKVNDEVICEIEKIGQLKNTVIKNS